MAKISLVIAIVVTLLTAGLAFMTKTKVDDLQGNLKNTKTALDTTTKTLKKTDADLKKTTEDLAVANKDIEDKKTQIGSLTTERDGLAKEKMDLATQIADKEKALADANGQLTKIQDQFKGINIDDLNNQIKKNADDLAKATAELAEKEQVITSLNNKVREESATAATANAQVKRYKDGIALNSFTGKIMAVNPGWNFVVVNVGDKEGATVNTPLIVMRNGQNIGKLKITSVDPTTSIADVIPGSMGRGQAVQPGDQVVFTARRGNTNSGAPAPAGAPQPQQASASNTIGNSLALPN